MVPQTHSENDTTMKKHWFFLIPTILLILLLLAMPGRIADAKKAPSGLYVGDPEAGDGTGAKGLVLKEFSGRVKHPDSIIQIRIPGFPRPSNLPTGARGRFSGVFFSAGNSLGFLFNSRINGRLRTSEIRQGGRKFLIGGKWTWRLNRNRLDKRARGKFNLEINRKFEDGAVVWEMSGPIRVGHMGNDPETNYTYRGRFKAILRP